MKTIKEKQILVGADFAGCPLKDAVVRHLQAKGWKVTDVGVQNPDEENPEMFHRIGFKVGAMVGEGEFERALLFCGTGMGIHLAANKCKGVQAAVVESVPSALRCVAANGCNILAMGSFYVSNRMGMAIADAFLEHNLGDGYEDWEGFYDYHEFASNEILNFDYEAYKANGFQFPEKADTWLGEEPKELAW